jgi:hypothetical protein
MKQITSVAMYMNTLQHPLKAEIEALRQIILSIDPRIKEEVKWNAPSFFIEHHFATFKLYPPKQIQVVLHADTKSKLKGASFRISDPHVLLTWAASDRCVATFTNMADLLQKKTAFVDIVKQWIEHTK